MGSSTISATFQDGGFFTTVSSNGTADRGAIIWAVGRPTDPSTNFVKLYAFAGLADCPGGVCSYRLLYSHNAGTWPNTGGNANIVPVAANGKVYVASNQTLTIFGDTAASAVKAIALKPQPVASLDSPHVISGKLKKVDGSILTLETRKGKEAKIDASQAIRNLTVGVRLKPGVPLTAEGSSINAAGALEATAIVRAKGSSGEAWPPDKPDQ